MKRILFMLLPVVVILLAYKPVKFHTVSGKVTDENGSPVAGASVVIKGTNTGSSSAQDGN